MLSNSTSKHAPTGLTPRKIGLLSVPVVISALMMYCGQQVNKIIDEKRSRVEETSPISQTEKTDIAESWREAGENQVLMIYRVKKGDTLSGIAKKHGVTLESILNINTKIVSPDAIQVGQAVMIPYDGNEDDTSETPLPSSQSTEKKSITFNQASLVKIMRNVLTRPEGNMLGALGNQPSDTARLKVIAEKTGLGNNVEDVRYANLCAANMRAVSASLREYLEGQGIGIDLTWKNGKNGIGVGKYFSDLKNQGKLPQGFEVIQTKSNPDATKLKQLLLNKGSEYSIFVLSYSHDVDGHVNIAFRVGNDIIIFDPSWRGHSRGWPERFHKFEDYIHHFVAGETTAGYAKAKNRYDLYNITCVPTYKIAPISRIAQHGAPTTTPGNLRKENNYDDMRGLTMVFEGFAPTMHIDTNNKSATTYAIGYGTNIGTKQDSYPFGSFGRDVAQYLKTHGHTVESIRHIMHGEKSITKAEGRGLFEMRYVTRYQKIKKHCGKDWNKYPPAIRNMLVDISYNLNGEYGIFPNGAYAGFPDAVTALNRGDWAGFMNAIADSKYARDDVGPRRVGAWFKIIVRDVLKNNTSRLSQDTKSILGIYTSKYKKDIEQQMAKRD